LKRTERAMIRTMCGMKLMDRKNTDEFMDMLRLNETLDKMAIASGARWLGHVMKRDESDVLREALQFEVDGRRGRPKIHGKSKSRKKYKRLV